jgi:hypothetical protein
MHEVQFAETALLFLRHRLSLAGLFGQAFANFHLREIFVFRITGLYGHGDLSYC